MDALEQSLQKAFINYKLSGTSYDPDFIVNQPDESRFLLTTLLSELRDCQSFFISVAFITQAGLNNLKAVLSDLNLRGVHGRILTSNYL